MFKQITIYLETKAPSIIGAPIFMTIAIILSLMEFIVNLDNSFKPMNKWR